MPKGKSSVFTHMEAKTELDKLSKAFLRMREIMLFENLEVTRYSIQVNKDKTVSIQVKHSPI